MPRILQDALGLNMKLVLGYRDTAAVFLAMERGEVSGRTTDLSAIQSTRPDWLKPNGGYRLLVQFGRLTRHPAYPDVPTARELATTDSGRALIEFTETPLFTMARPFAAPPACLGRARLRSRCRRAPRPAISRRGRKSQVYVSPVSAEEMVAASMMSRAPELFEQVRKSPRAQGRRLNAEQSKACGVGGMSCSRNTA